MNYYSKASFFTEWLPDSRVQPGGIFHTTMVSGPYKRDDLGRGRIPSRTEKAVLRAWVSRITLLYSYDSHVITHFIKIGHIGIWGVRRSAPDISPTTRSLCSFSMPDFSTCGFQNTLLDFKCFGHPAWSSRLVETIPHSIFVVLQQNSIVLVHC